MGSLVISDMIWASSSVLMVMLSTCLDELKEKFSRVSLCRWVFILFCMSVVRGLSHLYWRSVYLGGGALGFVWGMLESEVGIKEFVSNFQVLGVLC